jgi:hypothetical protein
MISSPIRTTTDSARSNRSELQQQALWLYCSRLLFQVGLLFVTFEQVRPLGIMLSDYCFFLSLLFFVPKSRLFKLTGSGILLGGALILAGALLSLREPGSLGDGAGPLARLFILFGLIAPLSLCHSKNIYKSMFFLVAGISVNCAVTLIQAWIFPGIVEVLSISPPQVDVGFSGRYQGLTEFPVTLGQECADPVVFIDRDLDLQRRRITQRFENISSILDPRHRDLCAAPKTAPSRDSGRIGGVGIFVGIDNLPGATCGVGVLGEIR